MRWAQIVGATVGVIAVATLSGCEKPPPSVTVWSGTGSVNEAAQCWSFESANLGPDQCAADILQGNRATGVPTLPITSGNTVGISVDNEVAAAGWTPIIGGQKVLEQPITDTYFRFTMPLVGPEQPIPLQIVAGKDANIRGVWIFQLQP